MKSQYDKTFDQAVKHLRKNDIFKAIKLFDECRQIEPANPEPYAQLTSCYVDINNLTKAEMVIKKAYEMYPNHSVINYILAQVMMIKGNTHEAIEYFKASISLDIQEESAYSNLVFLLLNKSKLIMDALDYLKIGLSKFPNSVDLNYLMALFLINEPEMFNDVNYLKIIDHLKKAMGKYKVLDTDELDVYYYLAETYYENDDIKNAVIYMEKYLKIYPNDSEMLIKLAECYLNTGKDEKGMNLLTEAARDGVPYAKEVLQSSFGISI